MKLIPLGSNLLVNLSDIVYVRRSATYPQGIYVELRTGTGFDVNITEAEFIDTVNQAS